LVPVDGKGLDWPRRVATAINSLTNRFSRGRSFPFDDLDADPASPGEGQTYYNTTTHKVRTFDGTVWYDLW
jgi:hypothetical protein